MISKRDGILYFSVVKNVEIIGEAAYMLTQEFKDAHPDTPWKIIIGMRHFLVHGYYEVDPDEVWNIIDKDLAPLLTSTRIRSPKLDVLAGGYHTDTGSSFLRSSGTKGYKKRKAPPTLLTPQVGT